MRKCLSLMGEGEIWWMLQKYQALSWDYLEIDLNLILIPTPAPPHLTFFYWEEMLLGLLTSVLLPSWLMGKPLASLIWITSLGGGLTLGTSSCWDTAVEIKIDYMRNPKNTSAVMAITCFLSYKNSSSEWVWDWRGVLGSPLSGTYSLSISPSCPRVPPRCLEKRQSQRVCAFSFRCFFGRFCCKKVWCEWQAFILEQLAPRR